MSDKFEKGDLVIKKDTIEPVMEILGLSMITQGNKPLPPTTLENQYVCFWEDKFGVHHEDFNVADLELFSKA